MNTPVSFEIAKLLKEKGFDIITKYHYPNLNIQKQEICLPTNWNKFTDMSGNSDYYSAPTIDEVKWWLYEKYGIWISVFEYKDHAADVNDDCVFRTSHTMLKEFKSPIEAYLFAIEYTLNNLI